MTAVTGGGNIIPRYSCIYIYIILDASALVAAHRVQCSKERRMQFQRVI